MKVRDLCTRSVRTCGPDTSLSEAGWAMWEGDCGILPIVDGENTALGAITDRDICMAVVTRDRSAARIAAREVSGGRLVTCRLEDDVRRALEIMRNEGVRRLLVVDSEGKLMGIISLNDLTLAARRGEPSRTNVVTHDELVPTLQAICRHRGSEAKAEKAAPTAPVRIQATVVATK